MGQADQATPARPEVGQVAIVTGAGRGLGRAVALALAEAGYDLSIAARTAAEVAETAELVRARGRRALASSLDVADWEAVQALVARTLAELGGLHVLVNAAGVQGPIGPLATSDVAAWVASVQTNLVGTYLCCRAVLPTLLAQRRGSIVNFSGGGATAPRPGFAAYAAAKTAVVRLTETLAAEVREAGVRVNAVAPGAVNTRLLEEVLAAGEAAGEEALAAARRQLASGGTPPELAARLVVFLASERAAGLTGKLVAAPYDGWEAWDAARIAELMAAPWLTLRRLDAHTLRPLVPALQAQEAASPTAASEAARSAPPGRPSG